MAQEVEYNPQINEYLIKIREEYAPLVQNFPFSPIGLGIAIKEDLTLFGQNKEGNKLTIHAGTYGLDKNTNLLMLEDFSEAITDAIEKAEAEGSLIKETDDKGEEVNRITSDTSFKVKATLIKNAAGANVSALEVWATLAVKHLSQESREDFANEVFKTFFQVSEPTSKTKRSRKKKTKSVNDYISMPIDKVSNALFGRGRNSIEPEQYLSGEAIKVSTGKDMHALLKLQIPETLAKASSSVYQLTDVDRYWLENAYSIAKNGQTTISGADLLKAAGFSNPYAENMSGTMSEAYRSINKLTSLQVSIDTTNEAIRYQTKRNREVIGQITLKSIIAAKETRVTAWKETTNSNGAKDKFMCDFEVVLAIDKEETALDAFPVCVYAESKGQLVEAPTDEFSFKTVKRITPEQRRMWRYIRRCLSSDYRGNIIKFETMFRELGRDDALENELAEAFTEAQAAKLEEANEVLTKKEQKKIETRIRSMESRRRDRLLNTLEKMLDERQAEGKLTYKFKEKNGKRYGVDIKEIGK